MSIWDILGWKDPNKQPGAKPDPNKGQYGDILPAYTQVEAYGKSFVSHEAKRNFENITGKTKNCPDCNNNSLTHCYCSTCNGTGKVGINFRV